MTYVAKLSPWHRMCHYSTMWCKVIRGHASLYRLSRLASRIIRCYCGGMVHSRLEPMAGMFLLYYIVSTNIILHLYYILPLSSLSFTRSLSLSLFLSISIAHTFYYFLSLSLSLISFLVFFASFSFLSCFLCFVFIFFSFLAGSDKPQDKLCFIHTN